MLHNNKGRKFLRQYLENVFGMSLRPLVTEQFF